MAQSPSSQVVNVTSERRPSSSAEPAPDDASLDVPRRGPAPSDDGMRTFVQPFRTTAQVDDPQMLAALRAALEDGDAGPALMTAQTLGEKTDVEHIGRLTSAPMGVDAEPDEGHITPEHPGRYVMAGVLGEGGMGAVMRVHDTVLHRDVAMKLLKKPHEAEPMYVAALRREARIIGELTHPAIIPVYELGVRPDGQTYYTMRMMPGRTLGEVIGALAMGDPQAVEEFSLRHLVGVFIQIAQGMEFAHKRGVVHRDLKPDNVQLGDYGEVFVTDWGVAKHYDRPHPGSEGMVIGTAAYMAPEQAAGHDSEVDPRSDIYALGVMLYEVLTLKRPYSAETRHQWLEAAKNVVPLPPSAVARDRVVPADLEVLCMRMLEKSAARRPASMKEVWQALDRFLAGDLERERRAQRAQEAYEEGLLHLQRCEELRTERALLREEEDALVREVRPWDAQEEKQRAWEVRRQREMLDVLYAHAFASANESLRQALTERAEHRLAREKLIELYWLRYDEASEAGDSATKLYFARQAHDLSNFGRTADAPQTGVVHIRSQPPGARIYAIPFDRIRDTRGKPGPESELGRAPITGRELPLGPYVLIARLDGHQDAVDTVHVRAGSQDFLLLCYPWSSELPMTGREVELKRLWSLLEDVELRSRPITCLVAGALGMGKNVLLDAFRRQVEEYPEKLYFLMEVSCDRLHADLPYSTVVELVRLRAGILETDTVEQARQKLRRMVEVAFSRMGQRKLSPRRQEEAAQLAATIAAMPAFDIQETGPRAGLRDEMAGDGKRRIADALARYFQAMALSAPVLVLVRNAQHMDPSTRLFFQDLLANLGGSPMLVVSSSTEQDDVEPLQSSALRHLVPRQPPFHFDEQLDLQPLGDQAVVQVVREMLGAPVSTKLAEWIQIHALGNPFLAGELTHLLARLGAMELDNAQWKLVRAHMPMDLKPGVVDAVIRQLIQTLPRHVQRCLSIAVVVGAEFWAGALQALGVEQLEDALDALVQAGFIVPTASPRYAGDREYRLTSTLRRRVAYDFLSPRERRELHRRTATWIASRGRTDLEEGLRLAHHLKMGGQPEEAALLYLRIARAAMTVGAEEEAERLYTQAHVLSGDPDLQGQVETALRALGAAARSRTR